MRWIRLQIHADIMMLYRQGTMFEKHLELYVPIPDSKLNENNICYNMDTNAIASTIEADLVYIDPPYNSKAVLRCVSFIRKM